MYASARFSNRRLTAVPRKPVLATSSGIATT
jgi:hypothetical protein